MILWIPPFYLYSLYLTLFSCRIALTKTLSSILNGNGKDEHPCLVPGFSESALSAFLLSMVLDVTLYINLKCASYIHDFFRNLIMKRCWSPFLRLIR